VCREIRKALYQNACAHTERAQQYQREQQRDQRVADYVFKEECSQGDRQPCIGGGRTSEGFSA
jgi:hypothetical protein